MYIKTKIGKTHLRKTGSFKKNSAALPVIGLHGGPGGTHASVVQLLNLSKNNRPVIVYDQIGSGWSDAIPKSKWQIQTFVRQLQEIVEHFQIEKFHLHGVSWGATLALEYHKATKRKKGGNVASIILHSPLISEPVWSAEAKKLIKKLSAQQQKIIQLCEDIGATDSKVYQKAMEQYYKKFVFRGKKRSPYSAKFRKFANNDLYQYMWGPSEFSATGTLKKWDGTKILKSIDCPILICCGQHDESTPFANRRFAKMNSQAQFKVIPKASHSTLAENTPATLKAFQQFIEKVEFELKIGK